MAHSDMFKENMPNEQCEPCGVNEEPQKAPEKESLLAASEAARAIFTEAKPIAYWEGKYPPRKLENGARVTRFAPSPTGFLHVGGALVALINEAEAERTGGVFILRIEDTDRTRIVKGAEEAIFNGLEWLGIKIGEGVREGGEYGPYKQSSRSELGIYQAYAKELVGRGRAYLCFCTSEELKKIKDEQEKAGQPPKYPGRCRDLDENSILEKLREGQSFTIRLKVPRDGFVEWKDATRKEPLGWACKDLDDQILLKSDGFPTYHLANVVDDHLMGVNTVYRGEEWISSTPKHLLLYQSFGWKAPEFGHLVLLKKFGTQKKLSKREGEAGLDWYRESGYLPEAIRNFLTRLVWAHPKDLDIYPYKDFVEGFDIKKLGAGGPQVNVELLDFINQHYLAAMDGAQRLQAVLKWAESFDTAFADILRGHRTEAEKYFSLEPERMEKISKAKELFGFYFDELYIQPQETEIVKEAGNMDVAQQAVSKYLGRFQADDDHDVWQSKVRGLSGELGLKDKNMFMLIRLVLTGARFSPPLFEVMKVLGGERVRRRLTDFAR